MKCFLDMDSVCVEFVGGLFNLYGNKNFDFRKYKWDLFEEFGFNEEKFWKEDSTVDFWSNLEPTAECSWIVELVENLFGRENVCMLTSPGYGEAASRAIRGKYNWIEKNLPQYKKQILFGCAKQFCASSDSVLIDDSDFNCNEFIKMGGYSIVFPRLWNSRWKETKIYNSNYLKNELTTIKNLSILKNKNNNII